MFKYCMHSRVELPDVYQVLMSFIFWRISNLISFNCSISDISTSVHINGEDARDFIAGLAENIGLENTRAAKMVSAAVAAHTRSRILQAWVCSLVHAT